MDRRDATIRARSRRGEGGAIDCLRTIAVGTAGPPLGSSCAHTGTQLYVTTLALLLLFVTQPSLTLLDP